MKSSAVKRHLSHEINSLSDSQSCQRAGNIEVSEVSPLRPKTELILGLANSLVPVQMASHLWCQHNNTHEGSLVMT